MGLSFWDDRTLEAAAQHVNGNSKPSDLKITDMQVATIKGAPMTDPIIRIGGKFRDKIRCYADSTESDDPKIYGDRLKTRKEEGFTWLKMDLGIDLMKERPRHDYCGRRRVNRRGRQRRAHVHRHRADAERHRNYDEFRRDRPRIRRLRYTPFVRSLRAHRRELVHAVDILHPDLATSGGLLETKKIGDSIQEYGIPMAMHLTGSPVSCMANVHCAAATENFLALENHSVDVPWWSDLVEGVERPIVNHGFITVPSAPGLGITLNDEVMKQHLLEPGYFEPTSEWDKEHSHDRLWS